MAVMQYETVLEFIQYKKDDSTLVKYLYEGTFGIWYFHGGGTHVHFYSLKLVGFSSWGFRLLFFDFLVFCLPLDFSFIFYHLTDYFKLLIKTWKQKQYIYGC